MEHLLPREPKPLGDALGEALAAEGIELCFGQHASAARKEDGEFVLEFPERDGACAATGCWWRRAAVPARTAWDWRTSGSSRASAGSRSTAA